MAALMLGRLLSRPDMAQPLSDFISWADEAVQHADPVQAPFLIPGVCNLLVLQARCSVLTPLGGL